MDEIEIISSEENKTKVQNLSIEELQKYKRELKETIKYLKNEIIKRQADTPTAESSFEKTVIRKNIINLKDLI